MWTSFARPAAPAPTSASSRRSPSACTRSARPSTVGSSPGPSSGPTRSSQPTERSPPRHPGNWRCGCSSSRPHLPFVPEEWHGERICAMVVCYSGDLNYVEEVFAPIRALGDPVVDLLSEQPYTQVQSYLDDGEPKGHHYYWKTEYCTDLTDELLSITRDLFAECPIPDAELGFLHLGGALNEHDEDDGAVRNRDARYMLGANGMWEPDEPNVDAFRQWIRDAWERQRPFSTGRTDINVQTADEDEERVRATYGANFGRLVEVKRKYDPDNLFRSNRNVRPLARAGK